MKYLRSKDQLILTRNICSDDLDDRMVALSEHLVHCANLTNRTGGIPPYFPIIKQLKKVVDKLQGQRMVPD